MRLTAVRSPVARGMSKRPGFPPLRRGVESGLPTPSEDEVRDRQDSMLTAPEAVGVTCVNSLEMWSYLLRSWQEFRVTSTRESSPLPRCASAASQILAHSSQAHVLLEVIIIFITR